MVSSRLDLPSVLEVTERELRAVLPMDVFFACLYDAETNMFTDHWVYDSGVRYHEPATSARKGLFATEVVETGEPMLLNRSADEIEITRPVLPLGDVTKTSASLMYAPLKVGERVVGVVSVQSYSLNAYGADHLNLLMGAANQVVIAVENARLYAQVQQRAAELSTLNEIGRAVSSRLDLDSVLEITYQQMQRSLPLDSFFVCFYDAETDLIAFPLLYDAGVRYEQPDSPLDRQTFLGQTIEFGAPQLLNRTPEELEKPLNRRPVGDPTRSSASLMFAPLRSGARVIGALSVQSYTVNAYTDDHLSLLTGVAHQVAVAIENARLHTEIQQYAEELEQRVEERTAELRQALIRAQEADRTKTDFVTNVNHELRTPLSNLKLYLRLLHKGHPEKRDFYLDTLDREINRLSVLVEDTLALASLGRHAPNWEVIDLGETARDAVTRFTALADGRQIALSFNPPDDEAPIRAEPDQIMRVFVNLLGNALTYTPSGGKVSLSVEVRDAGGGRWVVLTVRDNGPGIAPEDQKQIFTPYFRGQVGTESGVPGSGLGLAIVQEIVALHDGRIDLESALGEGAAFHVWFPLVAGVPVRAHEAQES
ncbi:MAG: GAF domain-containing protein [Anaerolineae bacterium]|nr:GAF domain-containing protein [Anaerolineae bacterium]